MNCTHALLVFTEKPDLTTNDRIWFFFLATAYIFGILKATGGCEVREQGYNRYMHIGGYTYYESSFVISAAAVMVELIRVELWLRLLV